MRIDFRHARIVVAHLLVQEHFHALPGCGSFWADERTEQLADASRFERKGQVDKSAAGHLFAEHRPGAKWAHDFIVAHVNHPQISVEALAVSRDAANDVRVDRRDRDVHDFNGLAEPFAQQHLENAREPERRLGVTHGRGFAENENTARALRFSCLKHNWLRRARKSGRKIAARKILVLDVNVAGF